MAWLVLIVHVSKYHAPYNDFIHFLATPSNVFFGWMNGGEWKSVTSCDEVSIG